MPILAVGVALSLSGGALIFTLLADLQSEFGFSDAGLGYIAFSFFGAALVVQLAFSRLADGGATRTLLIVGWLLSIAALVWFAFAESLWSLMAARALGGAGYGLFDPAARALAVRGHEEDAGRRLGLLSAAQTAGLVIGPVIGALIADQSGSLDAAFLTFAGAATLAAPLIATVPIRPPGHDAGPTVNPLSLLRRSGVRRAALVVIALTAPVGMYEVVWSPLLRSYGATTTLIGISVALYGLPFLLAAPLGGILGDRIGADKVARYAGFTMAAIVAAMGIANAVWILIAIGVCEAIVNASAIPNAYAAMSRATGTNEQAAGQGLAGAGSTVTIAAVTLAAGWIYGQFGQRGVFTMTAVLVVVLLGLASTQRPETSGERADRLASELAGPVPRGDAAATRSDLVT